jgi:dCTP diphosphatase
MSGEMNLDALQDAVVNFAHEREWEQFHDAKNLCMALASEVGELNAVLRWVRNDEVDAALADPRRKSALRQEIGDVAILLILLCARMGTRLDAAVIEKLELNTHKYPADKARGLPEDPGNTP